MQSALEDIMNAPLETLTKAELNNHLCAPLNAAALRRTRKSDLVALVRSEQSATTVPSFETPSEDAVAARAYARWRRGHGDAMENWFVATREATIALRAHALYRDGGQDELTNWLRAERELAEA